MTPRAGPDRYGTSTSRTWIASVRHLRNIFGKLDVRSRVEVARLVEEAGSKA